MPGLRVVILITSRADEVVSSALDFGYLVSFADDYRTDTENISIDVLSAYDTSDIHARGLLIEFSYSIRIPIVFFSESSNAVRVCECLAHEGAVICFGHLRLAIWPPFMKLALDHGAEGIPHIPPKNNATAVVSSLSPCEREVLHFLVHGLTAMETANKLGLCWDLTRHPPSKLYAANVNQSNITSERPKPNARVYFS